MNIAEILSALRAPLSVDPFSKGGPCRNDFTLHQKVSKGKRPCLEREGEKGFDHRSASTSAPHVLDRPGSAEVTFLQLFNQMDGPLNTRHETFCFCPLPSTRKGRGHMGVS